MSNTAMEYGPTFADRLWRGLGYHYHLGDEPNDIDGMPGWMRHEVRLHFGFWDRVRLLLTGKLHVVSVIYTDVPSPNVVKTRIDWQINRP